MNGTALIVDRVLARQQSADNRGAMILQTKTSVDADRSVVVGPSALVAVPFTTLETSS